VLFGTKLNEDCLYTQIFSTAQNPSSPCLILPVQHPTVFQVYNYVASCIEQNHLLNTLYSTI